MNVKNAVAARARTPLESPALRWVLYAVFYIVVAMGTARLGRSMSPTMTVDDAVAVSVIWPITLPLTLIVWAAR